jgi:hypothetical protein
MLIFLIILSSVALHGFAAAPSGPWDQFNFAPKNRSSSPTSVRSTQGNVQNAQALIGSGTAALTGNGSFIVLDFGQEVVIRHKDSEIYYSCKNRLEAAFSSTSINQPQTLDSPCLSANRLNLSVL